MIHPTAIIDPKAQLDPTVSVGPYAVIDGKVTLGPHCVVGPHAYLTGDTQAGAHNQFHHGCVVGGAPQDLKYRGKPTRLRVGDRNTFREGVTINRATEMDEDTVIGSDNLFMACCHVGHNCQIGNHIILVNGTLLAGHVLVGDRAVLSGTSMVHQFVRVGTLAMMQGGSAVAKDLPPYTMARGYNGICGLNIIGLRRAGMPAEERMELKKLYRALFRAGQNITEAVAAARGQFNTPSAKTLIEFVASSKRGVCADRGRSGGEEAGELE